MRKLVYCCLLLLLLMACGGKTQEVIGEWNMELVENGISSYSMVLADDTICVSELNFRKDTIYMHVKSDGVVVEEVFVGKYEVNGNRMTVINNYGEQKNCNFEIKDDIMIVREQDNPDNIIMRLKRARPQG